MTENREVLKHRQESDFGSMRLNVVAVLELLKVHSVHRSRLVSRENSRLEYKENFNWRNKAQYAKTLAAFANNVGGFIVFGVKDSPQDIVGLTSDRFEKVNPAKITEYLNTKFTPELDWDFGTVELAGRSLGVISVAPAKEKPVMCVSNDGNILHEAEIYYRYRGRSERIHAAELRQLMAENRKRDLEAFLKHVQKIVHLGPENVGVLDLLEGELSGSNTKIIMNEELLRNVQFIRNGRLSKSKEVGVPTLNVDGQVTVADSNALLPVRTIEAPKAIGQQEIMLGFLRRNRTRVPKEFLKQTCREGSTNLPVYHYLRLAGMTIKQMRDLILKENPKRKLLLRRVDGTRIKPFGSLKGDTKACEERKEVLSILQGERDMQVVLKYGHSRLFEAISHFRPNYTPEFLMDVLATLVEEEFHAMNSSERTMFRKAVSHLDELLNRNYCD